MIMSMLLMKKDKKQLSHKLREATRIGDVELQKYYLQQIVAKNKERM